MTIYSHYTHNGYIVRDFAEILEDGWASGFSLTGYDNFFFFLI